MGLIIYKVNGMACLSALIFFRSFYLSIKVQVINTKSDVKKTINEFVMQLLIATAKFNSK